MPIKNVPQKTNGYIVFDEKNRTEVLSGKYSPKVDYINKATAGSDPRITRSGYNPGDYYSSRPGEAGPYKFQDVIHACRRMYLCVNVVRNVVDLMTDFAAEDLRIVHPDKTIEAFFKVWMAKVGVRDAIDEFIRHLIVDGNVVVKRTTAKLSKPVQEQWMSKVMAADGDPVKLYKENQVSAREIPWSYSFLNVVALTWVGGESARALGERKLAFRLSEALVKAIRTPSDVFQQELVNRLPYGVRTAVITNNQDLVQLDMDQVFVGHNKKDSWEDWAPPFLYCVLDDVKFKSKLRQAETSALDGIINVLRLWKLGDHQAGILPGEEAFAKLAEILESNTGGGTTDILWDSMIDMETFYPPIDKILGEEKYAQVNRDILIGLGVPEVLIGGQGANFSNSWIQLKTLVEKLNYIRSKVKEWLYNEVHLVCQAMDIPVAPKIRFNEMNLEDEGASRKLIVGLLDRGVISVEAVLQAYGEDFLIEMERIKGQREILKDAKITVKSPLDQKPTTGVAKPAAPAGRPFKSNDVSTRNTRTAKPRRAAASDLLMKGIEVIEIFDKEILPMYMGSVGVANARKLTAHQREEIGKLRMSVLACINPEEDISIESVISAAENISDRCNMQVLSNMANAIKGFSAENGYMPTLKQQKNLEAIIWAEYHNGEYNGSRIFEDSK